LQTQSHPGGTSQETICESCTFFVTTIEFRPTLQAQRDDAAHKGQPDARRSTTASFSGSKTPALDTDHPHKPRLFQELPVHPQLGVLHPKPLQLGPLIDIQRSRRIIIPGAFPGHPAAQQLLTDPNLSSHLSDRPTSVNHQPGRLPPISRRVVPALPCRHADILSAGP
jgi:hypothetical protein